MTKPLINEKILWIYKLLLKNARQRSGGFSFKTKGKLIWRFVILSKKNISMPINKSRKMFNFAERNKKRLILT